jgi:peptidoglycan/LPS O-acetylase OafA/YrhL
VIAATFIGLSDILPCKSLALSILSNILLIQNWGVCHSYIGPAWSISTELAAYLLFPLLLHRLLKRTSLSAWADLACCLAGLSALCLYPTRPAEFVLHGPLDIWWPQSIWPLVRCLLGFTAGLAAWRLWNDAEMRARFAGPSASWLCAGLLIIVLAIPNLDVVFAALSAVFIICLASGDNAVTHLFGSRPAHFIGEISYALYLLHYPLMKLLKVEPQLAPHFGQVPAHILTLAAYAAILFALSVMAHRFIEVPCRTRLRRLERGL